MWKSIFSPWTLKQAKPSPWTFKTVRFPSLTGYKRFSKAVLSFYFLFISVESLKNHSKSQKNHKIKNPVLLNSAWVDIDSEHIIWYALEHIFCCSIRSMLFCNYFIAAVSMVQLWWNFYGELIIVCLNYSKN